jgi:Spy/CpxP family protein refolding chaperone
MSPNLTLPRSFDPKLAVVLTLSLAFLCGVAAGAVAMNLGAHNRLHQPAFDTPAGKAIYFARVQKELNLTPAQSEQMETILNDFWQYYRTVLTDSRSRVEQVLTDDQRRKWDHLLQEHLPR